MSDTCDHSKVYTFRENFGFQPVQSHRCLWCELDRLRAEVARLGGELKKAQALLTYTQAARMGELKYASRNFDAICNDVPYHSPAYGVAFDASLWATNRQRAALEREISPAPADEESER